MRLCVFLMGFDCFTLEIYPIFSGYIGDMQKFSGSFLNSCQCKPYFYYFFHFFGGFWTIFACFCSYMCYNKQCFV